MSAQIQDPGGGKVWYGWDGLGEYVLDDLRRNDLARTAPRGEAIQHHEGILGLERGVELGLRLEVVYAFLAHCSGEVSDALSLTDNPTLR